MRHLKKGRKFSRTSDQRKALLISLCSALLLHDKIKTTKARAKEASRFLEKLLTQAKKGNLSSRRILAKYFSGEIIQKIQRDIMPNLKDKPGGYTRILRLKQRRKDGAEMAIIELLGK